ncbi:hypothetical protein [Labilibaculum sp.]|uniref:hypothetical protein n=1 Tax=Labilibaculum sp. TaxID=2060723 RepID=UPI003567D408
MKKLLFGLLFVFAINVVSFANQPEITNFDNEISLAQDQEQTDVEKKKCAADCTKACCTKEANADKKTCCTKEAKADKKKCCTKTAKAKKDCSNSCETKEANAAKKCATDCTKECCKKS